MVKSLHPVGADTWPMVGEVQNYVSQHRQKVCRLFTSQRNRCSASCCSSLREWFSFRTASTSSKCICVERAGTHWPTFKRVWSACAHISSPILRIVPDALRQARIDAHASVSVHIARNPRSRILRSSAPYAPALNAGARAILRFHNSATTRRLRCTDLSSDGAQDDSERKILDRVLRTF